MLSTAYQVILPSIVIGIAMAVSTLLRSKHSEFTFKEALLNWPLYEKPPEATEALLGGGTESLTEELFFKRMKALRYLRKQFAIFKLVCNLSILLPSNAIALGRFLGTLLLFWDSYSLFRDRSIRTLF